MTRFLLRLTAAVFAVALIFFPQAGAEGAREGLALCANTLIPSLFPAFVLADLAIELGLGQWLGKRLSPVMEPVFHLGGACAAPLALGLLGGYPVGAQAVRRLLEQNLCSREEAQHLLCFCNNSGPGFILGVVGGTVFGNPVLGLFLWLVHALSAVCVGVLFRPEKTVSHSVTLPPPVRVSASAALTRAVKQALSSVLQVSAYVVLFQVILSLIQALPLPEFPWSESCEALLMGMLEMTGGVCALTDELSLVGRLALCAFLLGWGGLSVHCQTIALLEDTGLSFAPYIQSKLLQGLVGAGLCLILLPIFPGLPEEAAGAGTGFSLLPLLHIIPTVLFSLRRRKRGGKVKREAL